MRIIEPYARLEAGPLGDNSSDEFTHAMGLRLLRHIEYEARKSHRSEDAVTPDSWKRIINFVVLDKGDWSVVEHATVTVDAIVDRGITHEWVRHRLFSFTQESTRFVNYEKKMPPSFVCPFPYKLDEQGTPWPLGDADHLAMGQWLAGISECERVYKELLKAGKPPQIARSVFPNALASRIATTGNLRNWRHFFIMRTTQEAHPQMKQVTIPLLREFQSKIPLLFDDIEPGAKQSVSMAKVR